MEEHTSEKLTCSFCHRARPQVGELSCGHLMCAVCFPYYSRQLEKCYLCILATAEVKRSAMTFRSSGGFSANPEDKVFCTNSNCSFIGSLDEMERHKDFVCVLPSLPSASIIGRGVPADEGVSLQADEKLARGIGFEPETQASVRTSVDYLNSTGSERLPDYSLRHAVLTSTKGPKLKLDDSWAALSMMETKTKEGNERKPPRLTHEKFKTLRGALLEHLTDRRPDCEASEACAASLPPNYPMSERGDSEREPLRNSESRSSIDSVIQEIVPTICARIPRILPKQTFKTSYWSWGLWFNLFPLLLIVSAVLLGYSKQSRDASRPERRFDAQDKQAHDYVVWEVPSVTNLLAGAQFNKRDMQLSEFVDMHGYQVKLGVGATLNNVENVVNIWVTAVVVKANDNVWPVDESIQLRVEHPKPDLVQSYDFKAGQKGNWKEYSRILRGRLVYRQMQVESTSRIKYLRFSYFLTYEEGVEKQYIVDDKMTVGLKLYRPRST